MQIATLLSLAASITCVGVFTQQKKWPLAAAFAFSTAYTLLDKVVHVQAVPPVVIHALPLLFLALVVYETLTKVVMK